MRLLLIGDIFGEMGREILEEQLPLIKQEYGINFIIANGENIAHGKGIIERYYKFLLNQKVDVITMGNHTYSNKNIYTFIDDAKRMVRPINLIGENPGNDYVTVNYNGIKITVFQVVGRVFMNEAENPFLKAEEILKKVKSDIYICDFHGEATSEKIAFGLHFDGRINVIFGTHTHVQTNDAHLLPKGTMYISDVGMTGSLDSVIGVEENVIIHQYLTEERVRHVPKQTGRKQFNALMVEINETTHKVTKYDTINIVQ